MAKEKATQLVQLYERKTKNGITFYLHYSRNGEQVRENTHLRLTGDKENDKVTKKAAQMMQANKTAELLSNKTGIATESNNSKILLVDYLQKFADAEPRDTRKSQNYYNHIMRVRGMVADVDAKVKLCNLSKQFAEKFVDKLKVEGLAESSQSLYLVKLTAILNKAVKDDLLSVNPFVKVDNKPKMKSKEKTYLTQEELTSLCGIQTKNHHEKEIIDAFVLSCFCGLRYSDIIRLKKEHIEITNDSMRLKIETQKTKKYVSFILPKYCESIINDRLSNNNEFIFNMQSIASIERKLKEFAKRANIEKNISFHTARHTFATLLLTKGADLYTVSTLLGHSNISTTQVYAKIVDKKKDETIALLNNVL